LSNCFHIVVAMKPIEGTFAENALKHRVAGINIDECRIGTFTSSTPSGYDRLNAKQAKLGYRPSEYQKGIPDLPTSSGRFPANVILGHSEGCQCVGTKKVKSRKSEFPEKDEGRIDKSQWRFRPTSATSRGYAEGKETIEEWKCVEGCPVKAMDIQSGITTTKRIEKPSDCGGNTWGGTIQTHRGARGHSDTGGASRFFKQIEEYEVEE